MLYETIRGYADNLNALRDFIALIAPFLEEKHKEIVESQLDNLYIIAYGFHKSDPEKYPLDPDTKAEIERKISDGKLSIRVSEDGSADERTITVSLRGEVAHVVGQAVKAVKSSQSQKTLLYDSSLITLISTTELFLSQILHVFFDLYPDAAGSHDRFFSLSDLKAIGSIEEARRFLIDSKVEELMRGSLEDWLKFLKERVHLSMGYLDSDIERIKEVYQRRNVLVHNGGHVNSIYIAKVPVALRPGLSVGERLQVSSSYLRGAIDLLEEDFILIAAELWKKLDPDESNRASVLIDLAFVHLLAERWSIAEGLSQFVMNDGQMPERNRLIGQMNYWQCVKWQGRYETIRADVEAADFSAKDPVFQLALHALAERKEIFFRLLPDVLKAGTLSYHDLSAWPISREMRRDEAYKAFVQEHRVEFGIQSDPEPHRQLPPKQA